MKFGKLKAIGHNIAHSLGSGVGLPIGIYQTDVFGEATQSPEGYILVDFLAGTSSGGPVSERLAKAILLYREALHELCLSHGTEAAFFSELSARYFVSLNGWQYLVIVSDQSGHCSVDEFNWLHGKNETQQ